MATDHAFHRSTISTHRLRRVPDQARHRMPRHRARVHHVPADLHRSPRALAVFGAGLCALAMTLALAVATPATALPTAASFASEEVTISGCLKPAEMDDLFQVLKDDGETVLVSGDGLADHLGHTVSVTGTWKTKGETKYLAVSSVEHVAASCTSSS